MPPVFRCLYFFRFIFSWEDENCVNGASGVTGFNAGHEARAQKKARRLGTAGQFGRKRPTRAPDGDAAHPLPARLPAAQGTSPNFNLTEANLPNTEAIANGRTTSGTHHRSKASATSRIEPHSIPRDVQPARTNRAPANQCHGIDVAWAGKEPQSALSRA